jgi:hypothetical protein
MKYEILNKMDHFLIEIRESTIEKRRLKSLCSWSMIYNKLEYFYQQKQKRFICKANKAK